MNCRTRALVFGYRRVLATRLR